MKKNILIFMFLSVMTSAFSVGLNVTGFAGDVKGGDVGFIFFDKVNINMSAGVTYNTREITKDNTPLILVSPGLYILSSIFEGSDKKTSNYAGGFYQLDWTTPALRIGQVRFNGNIGIQESAGYDSFYGFDIFSVGMLGVNLGIRNIDFTAGYRCYISNEDMKNNNIKSSDIPKYSFSLTMKIKFDGNYAEVYGINYIIKSGTKIKLNRF